jgi:NAD(P)-dependent dehydrogenase (short-subunit alcohol dehydrogenase family)
VNARPEIEASVESVDLAGRTTLVTGTTGGVGRETALALARLGARVLVHGRDERRGRRLADRLDALGADPAFLRADFADLDAVRELAADVRDRIDGLDVLVNNVGAHHQKPRLTDVGAERAFAVNHLAPFLLTNRLLPALAEGSRVVTVASDVHNRADADDLTRDAVTGLDDYDGLRAYARSKLANVLFARALADRHDHFAAASCHPGFVPASGIWRNASLPVRATTGLLARLPAALVGRVVDSPAEAAATPVSLAASPGAADYSGEYVSDCEPVEPSPAARDDDLADRLWNLSADLVDLDG